MSDETRLNLDGPAADVVTAPRGGAGAGGAGRGPESYGEVPPGDAVDSRQLMDYLYVIYKRRWLVIAAFCLVVVGSALYTYTRIPLYRAFARVLIQQNRQNYGFKEVSNDATTDYQMQVAILRSRSLMKRTMMSLGIWQEHQTDTARPSQPAPVQPPAKSTVRSATDFVRGAFGFVTGSRPVQTSPEPGESTADARQIDGFLSGFSIAPGPSSGIIDIVYAGPDPVAAARYANALSQQYVEQNLESKSNQTKDVESWLTERMVDQRSKVEAAERALQEYRANNASVALDDRGTVIVQGLNELMNSVNKAHSDRIEKEALYNQVRALDGNRGAIETFAPIASMTNVQQARAALVSAQRAFQKASETYGDRHPDYQAAAAAVKSAEEQIGVEVTKAVEGVRLEFEKAKTAEAALAATLEEQKTQALSTNPSGVELQVLLRDVEANKQMYNQMMDRAREAGLSGEIKTNNIRILDQAEIPRAPISPNTRANMQYGLMTGLFIGLGLAFFFEYLDNRIKSPDEVRTQLGIAFLGLIPSTNSPANGQKNVTPLLSNGVPARFAEAFRAVRTNVLFSMPEENARTVLIASAGPGEGKTLVASNLAIALAQAGQRVIIVDCDLRRPRVHEVFNVPQEPGLSNLIVGDAKASEMIRTSTAGVTVLTAGRIPPNPAELLGSKRFKELLARLGTRFDWIVIDSPPVMAVTDAVVLGHLVSGVMFVASAETTNRHNARTAVDQLLQGRVRVLGAVLNRVDLERDSYYYARYYRREYADYYQKGSSRPPKVG